MPSVKNHHELIYVMRISIYKMLNHELKGTCTTNEIVSAEDQVNVTYDSGKLFVTMNYFKINIPGFDWGYIADRMEEDVFPEIFENEFSAGVPDKFIYRLNDYIQYEIPLPDYIQRYLITGAW